ncbi:MAG: hypothetical protein JWM95_3179 [Gemmatimonadetes bacterium]|nr:hypothetical protein [Gemmatimonadota bacterium]
MRKVMLGLGLAFSVGCFDDVLTGSSTVNGAYTLRTINGSPLPYTTAGSGTNKTETLDDVLTLYQGSTYAESGHVRKTVNGQVTTTNNTETGSYTLVGTSITLRSSDGTLGRIAMINANTMTFITDGVTSVFMK